MIEEGSSWLLRGVGEDGVIGIKIKVKIRIKMRGEEAGETFIVFSGAPMSPRL